MSVEIECPNCKGEGFIRHNQWPFGPTCTDCAGIGWRAMTDDEASDAAESALSDACEGEPPMSFSERTEMNAKRDAQWGVK